MSDELDGKDSELLKMIQKTLGNPKTRKSQLQLIKQVEPDIPIPEVDAEERVMAAVTPLQEEIRKLREEGARDKSISAIQESRKSIKEKYSLDDESVKKVEQLMIDKKIGDHEIAARIFTQDTQLATPTPSDGFKTVRMPSDKTLLENPVDWARNEAHAAIDELRGVRR